jgi:hypothetical protein
MFLGGCAAPSGDAPSRSLEAPSGVSRNARIDALRSKRGLSPVERLELAELEVAAGFPSAAESNFSAAIGSGALSGDDLFRAHMGHGRCAVARGSPEAAHARFQEAWRRARSDDQRDEALVALIPTDLALGRVDSARAHRREIKDAATPGLSDLDALIASAGEGPSKATPKPAAATASSARPKGRGLRPPEIIPRATWGARPVAGRETEPIGKPKMITLHHTADPKPPASDYGSTMARMRAYQNAHQGRNWADIGYHYVIDKEGRIVEGRPLNLKGAHAGSSAANERNIGVAMIGNFQSGEPTRRQYDALVSLVAWLCAEYDIGASKIYTHHEIKDWPGVSGATNCPGKKFDPYMARLKRDVGSRSGGAAAGGR